VGLRKVSSLLAAGLLALGLGTSVTGVAEAQASAPASVVSSVGGVRPAAVAVPTGTWVELWTPYITPTMHKCLDIPTSGVLYAQIYHCHGYASNGANQLWQFVPLGNGSYWIVNKYWGDCLVANSPSSGFTNVHTGTCVASANTYWEVIQSAYDPSSFLLWNDAWNQCAGSAAPVPSGDGNQKVRVWSCQNYSTFNDEVQRTTWRFG
jgi:hypothetical protein